jgi:AbrB family looped-hinge helix DNA binding protein
MAEKEIQPPANKKFYGSITVSERGQIVIPAEARKDFNIKAGDKLLVLGDLEEGIAIVTLEKIQKLMANSALFIQMMQSEVGKQTGNGSE